MIFSSGLFHWIVVFVWSNAYTSTKGLINRVLRPQSPQEANPLFLSYIKPHKPVTSQKIAHWIEVLKNEAGINTQVFKEASTKAALTKGMQITDIMAGGYVKVLLEP